MAEAATLLAYLVPKLTSQVEDAATDALAFILNRSMACRGALDRLLRDGDFNPGSIERVETQVTYKDGSRPDMAGYDRNDAKRLLVEAKFWALLGRRQASGYFEQLEEAGPGVLLFIAPDSRIETLWAEIKRQMESGEGNVKMESIETTDRTRRARVVGSDKRIMLVSWNQLLGNIAIATVDDTRVASDIQQLRGLAERQDEEAFLPIHPAEFGLSLPRRIRGLNRLIDDVVNRCGEGWLLPTGVATAQGYFGRYFKFSGVKGRLDLDDRLGLTVNYERWATSGDTPLWLLIGSGVPVSFANVRAIFPSLVKLSPQWGICEVPIHLKTGVEYESEVDYVVQQIRAIRDIVDDQ